ncbi:MAG TPA: ATP-grasp domain-containing protein [Blastocatellia bacterium]|nr:ATP-grasp domain-containing protein [Blastocatellia bacterium]
MPRVLLLLPTTTYRTKAYLDAARRMGVDVVAASEWASTLAAHNPKGLLTLDLFNADEAARQAQRYANEYAIDAVIPVDEDTAVAAAAIADGLRLNYNPPAAARAAKNKRLMRDVLSRAGVRVPRYQAFSLDEDAREVAARLDYPCVVKPTFLSTSRGVMRADNEEEFAHVVERLSRIVSDPKLARRGGPQTREALVEEFIPGFEVAVEGLVTDGEFRALAIFDKPDPLDGPFFEETIYVTPSRLSEAVQRDIIETAAAATRAMGMTRGPVHAELRVNERGAYVIEVAARTIGGLCARALKFGEDWSLEEVVIRHALGEDLRAVERERQAAGVMMIPIPRAGTLREVFGLDEARQVADIEDIIITAHLTQQIAPPPEGASYLGFIFSRAATPDRVEAALRQAHARLEFIIV